MIEKALWFIVITLSLFHAEYVGISMNCETMEAQSMTAMRTGATKRHIRLQ